MASKSKSTTASGNKETFSLISKRNLLSRYPHLENLLREYKKDEYKDAYKLDTLYSIPIISDAFIKEMNIAEGIPQSVFRDINDFLRVIKYKDIPQYTEVIQMFLLEEAGEIEEGDFYLQDLTRYYVDKINTLANIGANDMAFYFIEHYVIPNVGDEFFKILTKEDSKIVTVNNSFAKFIQENFYSIPLIFGDTTSITARLKATEEDIKNVQNSLEIIFHFTKEKSLICEFLFFFAYTQLNLGGLPLVRFYYQPKYQSVFQFLEWLKNNEETRNGESPSILALAEAFAKLYRICVTRVPLRSFELKRLLLLDTSANLLDLANEMVKLDDMKKIIIYHLFLYDAGFTEISESEIEKYWENEERTIWQGLSELVDLLIPEPKRR